MIVIGWLDKIFRRNSEPESLFDFDIFDVKTAKRIHMKQLAIGTCISFLGRTISQSEFRVKNNNEFLKDELYYKFNIRPSKNVTASSFWESVIYKLIYDNECLIIKTDDDDLLVADNFLHNSYAVLEDSFTNVEVKDYEFRRTFKQNEVLHLKYANEKLAPLIDSLFSDYGELFGRVLNSQKRKNQVRGTVDMDLLGAKTKEAREELQTFIDRMYESISEKDVAIVPQQKGIKYEEHFSGSSQGQQSVDEINKVTNGFLDQVAMAIGIPIGLIHGEMSGIEDQTKNYLNFTVSPLLKKISDEVNAKFIDKEDFLNGKRIDIRKVSYQSIFDLATAIDKLVSSSAFTPNELRDEAAYERSDNPMLDKHYMTKNYAENIEGGENE